MNTIQKKYGVLLGAGGMAVCMAAGLMIGIHCSRDCTQKRVIDATEQNTASEPQGLESTEPYEVKEDFSNLDGRLCNDVVGENITILTVARFLWRICPVRYAIMKKSCGSKKRWGLSCLTKESRKTPFV